MKILQVSAFSFIVLNLIKKAVLHFLSNMMDYIKSTLRNKQLTTSNADSFKGKSWKPLKTSVFSFIIVNLVNKGILHFLVTTGALFKGGGKEVSPALSRKLEKSALILGKSAKLWVKFLI